MDSIKTTNNSNTMNSNNDISMTEFVTSKPSCKRTGEPNPLMFKAAARNLREYHGVPSITPGGLETTMVLLELRPARLVAQGLAPKILLKGNSTAGVDADSTDGSGGFEAEEEQANNQFSHDLSSNSSDGGDTGNDNIVTQNSIGFEARASKHPIQAVFVAVGVQLRPRETRPLLRGVVLLTSSTVALEVVATTTAAEVWVGLVTRLRMALRRTVMATVLEGVLLAVITAARQALPTDHLPDRWKKPAEGISTTDPVTTTTTTRAKKKWRCMPGGAALPTDCTPRTYADSAALVAMATTKCTRSTTDPATTTTAARAKTKKKWRCTPGRAALRTDCTPRTYADSAALVAMATTKCTRSTTDPATTTTAARAKAKKKWRCTPGRAALRTDCTPRTYADIAALVATACPCPTAKCTCPPTDPATTTTARAKEKKWP
ncbi:unnamed protein product [Ectocarpus sp. CCAP 1310/34]|nr:unnamed protein product [Ectocarpus sp. CCAP 1310/34]